MSKAKKPKTQPKLPRRPLQVGDRVSFEGFAFSHVPGRFGWRFGKGKIVEVGPRLATVEEEILKGHHELGLRSFRRLVAKKRSSPGGGK